MVSDIKNIDTKEFDDVRAITHALRHCCEGKKTLKKALPLIEAQTKLSKTRIEEILKKYFSDNSLQSKKV